jgi:hypothetical protein
MIMVVPVAGDKKLSDRMSYWVGLYFVGTVARNRFNDIVASDMASEAFNKPGR